MIPKEAKEALKKLEGLSNCIEQMQKDVKEMRSLLRLQNEMIFKLLEATSVLKENYELLHKEELEKRRESNENT